MFGDVEVDDAPAVVGEDDEDEEDAEACGGNREEIDGDQVLDVVGEEGAPGLRRGRAPLGEQPRDRALGYVNFGSEPTDQPLAPYCPENSSHAQAARW